MPQLARRSLLLFAALTLAAGLATPAQSQVIVGSFLSINSSGFQVQHLQIKNTNAVVKKKHKSNGKGGLGKEPTMQNIKPLFSWEDIQEFQKKHWEKWYASQLSPLRSAPQSRRLPPPRLDSRR